jgi:hypothetical protein
MVDNDTQTPVAPAVDPDREWPMPFAKFSAAHLHGTDDHIYHGLLRRRHGDRARTPTEWRALLERLRNEPAYRH